MRELLPYSAYETWRPISMPRTALVWVAMVLGMSWSGERYRRQMYDGTATYMSPPPPGQFDARLLCSMMIGRFAVGGHLYIGSAEPPRLGWLGLFVRRTRAERLVMSLGGIRDQFMVPEAQLTVSELRAMVGA